MRSCFLLFNSSVIQLLAFTKCLGNEDVNIWVELGTDFGAEQKRADGKTEKDEIKGASLNQLVAAITPHTDLPGTNYLKLVTWKLSL